jgi:cell division septal protein FtsQ
MTIRRRPTRDLQQKIALLQSSTRERQRRDRTIRFVVYGGLILVGMVLVGIAVNRGLDSTLNRVLYNNPRYNLEHIDIEPAELFSPHQIREAAGLDFGDNLWKLDLKKITEDVQTLPYVSSCRVERRFPDKIIIRICERVPLVKITGVNSETGSRETFYLDHDRIVLKPRANEMLPPLPEIINLSTADLEPGKAVDLPMVKHALEILDKMSHSPLPLHNIDIRTIDLSEPLSIRVVTTHDLVIVFRLDFVDQQLARLQKIMDLAEGTQRTLRSVDLTPDRNVPVTFFAESPNSN